MNIEDQELCQSCQGILCGCQANITDQIFDASGKLVKCDMYMKRVKPGYCENCESGGRL